LNSHTYFNWLIKINFQFDTIYHEHFSYLSLITIKQVFEYHGLELFDVEEVPTHGGSLRIFVKHTEDKSKSISINVKSVLDKEIKAGMSNIAFYQSFQEKAEKVKNNFTLFLVQAKNEGKKVAGYGAAAKGNTLLNFAGIKRDLLQFVIDASPYKQNKFLPGAHIPIFSEDKIGIEKPDYIVILPWNLKEEISTQLSYIRQWGGKFVVAVPQIEIF
jgi:hypothetical protein